MRTRPPSARMLPNIVVPLGLKFGQDVDAGRTNQVETPMPSALYCSVQPAKAWRVMEAMRAGMKLDITVYFIEDVGLQVDDLIQQTDKVGLPRLRVIGFRNEAGRDCIWAADCEALTP